ncbi:MAG: Lrp/AsnC family transcriptional regulator [archaeon]
MVRRLMRDSRASYSQLARDFDVTETAIRKRMHKLEDDGVIIRYSAEIDPRKLGYSMRTLIGLDAEPSAYIPTIEQLKAMEEPLSIFSTTGDHMLMIECWFGSSADLQVFVKRVEELPGVTRICPAIVLERIK